MISAARRVWTWVHEIGRARDDFNRAPGARGRVDRPGRGDYRGGETSRDFRLRDEWIWAGAICAAPLVIFGLVELVAALRRRRRLAIARRPKPAAATPRPPGRAD